MREISKAEVLAGLASICLSVCVAVLPLVFVDSIYAATAYVPSTNEATVEGLKDGSWKSTYDWTADSTGSAR